MVLPYEDGHAVLKVEKGVAGPGGQDSTHTVEKFGGEAEGLQRRNMEISPLCRYRFDDAQHHDNNEHVTPLRHEFSPPAPKPENLRYLSVKWLIPVP
jgi:hypothetical protein